MIYVSYYQHRKHWNNQLLPLHKSNRHDYSFNIILIFQTTKFSGFFKYILPSQCFLTLQKVTEFMVLNATLHQTCGFSESLVIFLGYPQESEALVWKILDSHKYIWYFYLPHPIPNVSFPKRSMAKALLLTPCSLPVFRSHLLPQ